MGSEWKEHDDRQKHRTAADKQADQPKLTLFMIKTL